MTNAKKLLVVLGAVAGAAIAPEVMAQATPAALSVSDATTYLQTNAQTNMTTVGGVMFVLAGIAVAITWVKAQFFG